MSIRMASLFFLVEEVPFQLKLIGHCSSENLYSLITKKFN
jgi:hypothetical protein